MVWHVGTWYLALSRIEFLMGIQGFDFGVMISICEECQRRCACRISMNLSSPCLVTTRVLLPSSFRDSPCRFRPHISLQYPPSCDAQFYFRVMMSGRCISTAASVSATPPSTSTSDPRDSSLPLLSPLIPSACPQSRSVVCSALSSSSSMV